MYTPEQYQKAKAALADPEMEKRVGPERMGNWARKVAEYEHAQAAPSGPSLSDEDLAKLEAQPLSAPPVNDTTPPAFQPTPDPERDEALPNASKLKSLNVPPEYVTKTPGKALLMLARAQQMDPLDWATSTSYFEPTEKQFQAEMGPYLKAKGIQPGTDEYGLAFGEYKDRKWKQAYDKAAAEDRPLMRVEYVNNDPTGWKHLQAEVAKNVDTASAFAKAFASGGTFGMTRALSTDADREQAARHPIASTIGEMGGAVSPGSFVGKLAGSLGRASAGLGRYGAAAVAGGISAPVDVASHAGADALSDRLHGRRLDEDARNSFARKLFASSLLGAGAGVFGEGVASLAQRYRTNLRSPTHELGTELTNAESTGTATDALRGVDPSSDVRRYLEAGRGPVPGENKPLPMGSPVELATADVRGPIVAQQEIERSAALKRMEEESGRMYATDPNLKQPKPMTELGKALRQAIIERSQPEAAGQFLPGPGDALGARNNSQLINFARDVYKPRLVLGVDAGREAGRAGGEVVSIDDARRMGFNIKGLENEVNPETGIPHNAPSLSAFDESALPEVHFGDVATKPTRELLQAHDAELAARGAIPPSQLEAIKKYSMGYDKGIRAAQRGGDDAAIIADRLEKYGVHADKYGLPHDQYVANARRYADELAAYMQSSQPSTHAGTVYRGLRLPRDKALELLRRTSLDADPAVSSASLNPDVAYSFATDTATAAGDTGVILKIEQGSARGIHKDAVIGQEREVLLPGNGQYEITGRYRDASDPNLFIVTAREKGLPVSAGAETRTMPEIDSGAAAKPDIEVPQNYPKDQFQVILEPRYYDALKMEAQIKAIDQAGKAGTEAKVDPVWPELMRAARVDREQFGKAWSGLKSVHHEELTALEQRAAHAGITERSPYPEMSGNAQKTANGAITNYGVAPMETNKAIAELADNAGVRPGLETLRGTRAYSALKELATPKVTEGVTSGGSFTRLGGLLPGAKLRGDALARSLTRGPQGEPLFVAGANPRPGEPIAREYSSSGPFGNLLSMGRGALGVKTGSVYDSYSGRAGPGNTLSPEERAKLESMLAQ